MIMVIKTLDGIDDVLEGEKSVDIDSSGQLGNIHQKALKRYESNYYYFDLSLLNEQEYKAFMNLISDYGLYQGWNILIPQEM